MTDWKVPWSTLRFSRDEREAVAKVMMSDWLSKGPVSDMFEADLESYLKTKVALVNSGSSALMVSLLAHGIKAGDTVLVPDFTYMATASVPLMLGCKVVPVDCDRETFNIDIAHLMVQLDYFKPRALLVTDVAGAPIVDISLIERMCANRGVRLIEDACEAFGAEVNGRKVGDSNHTTCFSFETTKILTTIQGGAIASRDEQFLERAKQIASYGSSRMGGYIFDSVGTNCRTTEINSAIGIEQLKWVDREITRRAEIMKRYGELPGLTFQSVAEGKSANWMALATTEDRHGVLRRLNSKGVEARVAFVPVHLQPIFKHLNNSRDYPNADHLNRCGLTLPIYNRMRDDEVQLVIDAHNSKD